MRPLDSEEVFSSHGRGNRLPPVSGWLRIDNLLHLHHIHWIQVIQIFLHQKCIYSTSRVCDSRNLNLSPFCNLTSTSLVKWQPSLRETYENISTSYTSELSGPMRLKYPTSMAENELLSSLTEVNDFSCILLYLELDTYSDQSNTPKGKPSVQRLWKGHRCCQSVLWRLNCVRWFIWHYLLV